MESSTISTIVAIATIITAFGTIYSGFLTRKSINNQQYWNLYNRIQEIKHVFLSLENQYQQLTTKQLFRYYEIKDEENLARELQTFELGHSYYINFNLPKNHTEYTKQLLLLLQELENICFTLYKSDFFNITLKVKEKFGSKREKRSHYFKMLYSKKHREKTNLKYNIWYLNKLFTFIKPLFLSYGSIGYSLLYKNPKDYLNFIKFLYNDVENKPIKLDTADIYTNPHNYLLDYFYKHTLYFEDALTMPEEKFVEKYHLKMIKKHSLTGLSEFREFDKSIDQKSFISTQIDYKRLQRFSTVVYYYREFYGTTSEWTYYSLEQENSSIDINELKNMFTILDENISTICKNIENLNIRFEEKLLEIQKNQNSARDKKENE